MLAQHVIAKLCLIAAVVGASASIAQPSGVTLVIAAGLRSARASDGMSGQTCLLVPGGDISGAVSDGGALVPDGTYVAVTFQGGPTIVTATQDGKYVAPTLARACVDGPHWVGLEVIVGRQSKGFYPNNWQFQANVDAVDAVSMFDRSAYPNGAPPLCTLALGTVSGNVSVDGVPAPDGTIVSALTGPETEDLAQSVLTANGRYMLTSVGTQCEGQQPTFLAMTLSVAGATVQFTPTEAQSDEDISTQSQATASQTISGS